MSHPATDLLLVAPPLLWGQEERRDMKPPLNLLYLAGWLEHRGYRAAIHDVNASGLPLTAVVERIAEIGPRFLGVPFYQATRETALALCAAVRERLPETWIIAGGPLVTTSPEDLLACPEIDLCVIGEGEVTLEEILRCGLPKRTHPAPGFAALNGVAGLAWSDQGTPVFTGPRKPIANLDDLPFLDFRLIDIDWYFRHYDTIGMSPWLFLTTSRGCQAKCTFCATPVLWPDGLRRQSVPRLLAEIAHQRSLFPQSQFAFMDDTFFTDKRWLHEFFDGIGGLKVKYCCIGRADHLRPEDVRRLGETGCIYVAMGVETGNQARQHALRKHLDLDGVRTAVRLLAQHNVFCKCFFMLGFPDETPAEMLETINFAVELKRLGMGECNFFPVSIYPGTELAKLASDAARTSTIYGESLGKAPSPAFPEAASGASNNGIGDPGEEKLRRYANIPKGNVNRFFASTQLLEIVKLAYRKVEATEPATLDDFPDP